MSLATKLAAGPPVRKSRSRITEWLNTLDAVDRDAALTVLTGTEWSASQLRTEFRESGLDVTDSAITQYRRELRAIAR